MISLAGGTALGQVLLLITSPVLTRIYKPDEMGKLGLFTTFVSFCVVVVVLGYETSIVAVKDPDDADRLSLVSLLLVVPMSVLCAMTALIFVKRNYGGYGVFPTWIQVLIGIGSALNGWLFVLRYRCIRDQQFEVVRRIPIYQNLGRSVTQVGFGLLGLGWIGLCVGELLGRCLGLETVVRELSSRIRKQWQNLTYASAWRLLKRYREFPQYILPSALVGAVAQNIPLLLIAAYYGIFDAGYYALLQRVLAMPISLVGTSAADVFHARFAHLVNTRSGNARHLFLKTIAALFCIGIVPTVVVMAWGAEIFSVVLGSAWRESGRYAVYIAPWALFQLAISPVTRIIAVLEGNGKKLKFLYDAASLAGTVLVFWAGHRVAASIYRVLFAVSAVNVLTYILYFVILLQAISHHEATMQHALQPALVGED